MVEIANGVKESISGTPGTALTITLAGAEAGYIAMGTPSNISDGTEVYYSIRDGLNYEIGIGTWNTGGTMDRTTVLEKLESGTHTENPGTRLSLSGSATISIEPATDIFSQTRDREITLLNGDFSLWQRATSQTSSGRGSDDMWINEHVGSSKTHSRQTFAVGQTDVAGNPKYYSRTVVTHVTAAGNYTVKQQKIEYVDTYSGDTITISFDAKADATKNVAVEVIQNFGTGGSPSSSVRVSPVTVGLTTSWDRKSVTLDIPSISGKTLGTNGDDNLVFVIWMDAGTTFNAFTNSLGNQSGTFDFAQFEIRRSRSKVKHEKLHEHLNYLLCRRYYRKQDFYVPATTAQSLGVIDMRKTPSITGGGTGFTSTGTTKDTLIAYQTTGGVQTLELSAEI